MAQAIVKNDCSFGVIRFRDHGFGDLPGGAAIGPGCWDWFDILCVHRGGVRMTVAGAGRFELRQGDGLLILPRTRFYGAALRRGARISVQHFEPLDPHDAATPQPLAWCADRAHGAELFHFQNDQPLATDIQRAVAFAFQTPTRALHDMRVAQLILILGQVQDRARSIGGKAGDRRALDLQQRLNAAQRIQDVTPTMMAAWVGLSGSRFRVWFKEQFNLSPKAYLTRRRVSAAMRLLRETQLPIKAIADELGYADLPTFYHDFRGRTQTSPGAYRRNHTVRW